MNKTTLVTGLWDIGRGDLSESWSRKFDHYLSKFSQLLKTENNMIIFGEKDLEEFVFKHRKQENTQFICRNKEWFKNEFFDKIQKIRNNPKWYDQAGWLKDSTQAKLEWYNPLVMSKMFLLNDAKILDKFNSSSMYWIDAGICNTVHSGYFTHDKIQNKIENIFEKFTFIAFPYDANNEIHGFSYPKINEYADKNVKLVCRGGFFGGPKDTISQISSLYYNVLGNTLDDGYMGTEESIFSIMLYKYNDLIDYVEIDYNGLISKFCEDVKNGKCVLKDTSEKNKINSNLNIKNTALYVITFNSPKQFETLIESMLSYDKDFIEKPKKFLLDNSSDLSTTPKYVELCEKYGFEHIKKDNLGICGGRQFIAEHFDQTNLDFYFFFEDDMFLNPNKEQKCKNGFSVYVENLYEKSLKITKENNYDFLKLSFTEFYGDNSVCWPWYNVPQDARLKLFPEKPNLPKRGFDPDAPKTKFKNIKSFKGLPYVDGEVYYCNWPQVVSKRGNVKMFLETKWARPHEQTYMSYIYQETLKGKINPALLLLTPISHNRFDHYSAGLRKES
jgi:hypothetical protein